MQQLLILMSLFLLLNAEQHGSIFQATNPKPFDYNYKLPEDMIPTNYRLYFTLIPKDAYIEGKVVITMLCKKSNDKVILHAHKDWINVNLVSFNGVLLPKPTYEETKQTITVHLNHTTTIDVHYNLALTFYTKLHTGEKESLGIIKQMPKGSHYHTYVTSFRMYGARRAFPCFDEPKFKAQFELDLEVYDNLTHPEIKAISSSQGTKKENSWHFDQTLRMATYNFAFALGPYKSVCSDKGPADQCNTRLAPGKAPKVCHWLLSNSHKNKTLVDRAIELNKISLDAYCNMQKYLNTESPFQLQILWVTHRSGSSENWGLIYVSENDALDCTAELYAHEIIHYWFGSLVTPSKWKDYWLSESLASYYGMYSDAAIAMPKQDILLYARIMFKMIVVFNSDKWGGPSIVDKSWAKGLQTEGLEFAIGEKGPLVLLMLYFTLGDEPFRYAMVEHMRSYSYANATTEDLMEVFQKQVSIHHIKGWKGILNVTKYLNPFLYKSSYPNLTITTSPKQMKITKEVPHGEKAEDWVVPLWLTTTQDGDTYGERNELHWIVNRETVIDVSKKTQLNKNTFGYYQIVMSTGSQ